MSVPSLGARCDQSIAGLNNWINEDLSHRRFSVDYNTGSAGGFSAIFGGISIFVFAHAATDGDEGDFGAAAITATASVLLACMARWSCRRGKEDFSHRMGRLIDLSQRAVTVLTRASAFDRENQIDPFLKDKLNSEVDEVSKLITDPHFRRRSCCGHAPFKIYPTPEDLDLKQRKYDIESLERLLEISQDRRETKSTPPPPKMNEWTQFLQKSKDDILAASKPSENPIYNAFKERLLDNASPYALLGLSENFTPEMFKEAKRVHLLALHPDKNKDSPESTELFKCLKKVLARLEESERTGEIHWHESKGSDMV